MSAAQHRFLALDAGDSLVLLAAWNSAGGPAGELEASWPLRARLEELHAFAARDMLANARAEAVRLSRDPRRTMLARLGNTPLSFACDVAERAGIADVIIPACSCALWSEGILVANAIQEYVRPVPPCEHIELELLRDLFVEIMEEAAEYVQAMALDQDDSLLDRFADVRYLGQAAAVTVPVESLTDLERLLRPFHAAYSRRFAEAAPRVPVEVSAVRARCILSTLYPVPRISRLSDVTHPPLPAGWIGHDLSNGHRLIRRSGAG